MPAPLISAAPPAQTPAQLAAAENAAGLTEAQKANVATGTQSTTLAQDQAKAANQGKPGFDVLGNPVSPAVSAATNTETNNSSAATTLGNKNNSNSTNPFISSSDSVEADEANTSNTINNLSANNQATTDAHNTYLQNLAAETAALEARRTSEVSGINADFDSQDATLKDTQDRETGQETILGQRSGGYLGSGASQTGALISLAQTHATEQSQLESRRQAAIQAAQNAVDEKQFAVANAQAQEAKDYAKAMADNQQQYLSNKLAIQKSQEDAVSFAQSQADTQLKGFSNLSPEDISKIDPAAFEAIDKAYGVQGFAQNYLAATSAANAAKSQGDLVDAQQKLLTLLQDIPQGKKVSFADPSDPNGPGITYTGMGKIGDIATFEETDNYGNITIVSYNKATNTVTRTAAGSGGKTSAAVDSQHQTGTRLGYMDEFISDPKNNILIPADPTNPDSPKYMTSDNYVAMYQKYVKTYPGQGAEFLSQYPIAETVLPTQRKSTELDSFKQTSPAAN